MKVLPKAEHEPREPKYRKPKMRSRRYPVKVMYLGVVANPQEERNFDGRVYLKRVSNQVTATRRSTNQRFSDDVDVNTAIMNGEWTEVVTLNMRAEEALDAISQHYDLDEYVAERLKMNYVSYTRNGKKETKKLNGNVTMGELGMKTRQDGEREPLLLKELKLGVEVQVGDVVEKDCSCDSEYMLRVMPEIGQALRNKFSWVAATDPVYLVMDNAGGHGTNDAKTIYTEALKAYNIEIIWQITKSPETNMLDLGIWMSIQAKVEKMHHMKRCHHDALAKSVETAWESYLDKGAFSCIFKRMRVVLTCIVDDHGGNEKVEDKRGVLYLDATIVDLTNEDEDEQNEYIIDITADIDEDDDLCSVASFE